MGDNEDNHRGAGSEPEIMQLRRELALSQAQVARQRAEIQHRVRNLLSLIRAINNRSFERATSLEQIAMHQGGRISALARVEDALDAAAGTGADLERLLWQEWLVVLSPSEEWRAEATGPPVRLAMKTAERIGLAFHELTTNALKFGALASPEGRLCVDWDVVDGDLVISWIESNVALMNISPKHVGFGRDLLESGLPYDLRAETTLSFAPSGLKCVIRLPIRNNGIQPNAANSEDQDGSAS